MEFQVEFHITNQTFTPSFEKVNNVSDGGYERGYAVGYETGNKEGYTKGHTDGVEQGYADGVESAQADIVGLVGKTYSTFKNDNVTSIGSYMFAEIGGLEVVDLPNCEIVGNYAFQSSTRLYTVNLPKVKTIGVRSFVNTNGVQTLDLPVCTSIGNYCFHGSSKLKTLILRSATVCKAGTDIFGANPIASKTGYVYVPKNLVEQYKTASGWTNYASQIRAIEDYPEL